MRLAVTGRSGQLALALAEAAPAAGADLVFLARPVFDLADPATIAPALAAARVDAVISAAAHTAVDRAESEADLAFAVNAEGPGRLAAAAAALGLPIVHLSTDYVFSGDKTEPYVEDDATGPLNVYGASKLEGERRVASANPDHAILRTSWVHGPHGRNFVATMLSLAAKTDRVRVVADQVGRPTATPHLAAAVLAVARSLVERPGEAQLRGVFHASGSGETSWAGFAEAIFAGLARRGGPLVAAEPIATADWPTPARRPMNSRLAGERLARVHGLVLPDWRTGLDTVLDRLVGPVAGETDREEGR